MATSGSVSSPAGAYGAVLRLDWDRTATNTTTRTSTIRYRLYLTLGTGSWVDARESGKISTTDGDSSFSRGTTSRGPGGTHLLHEYTVNVSHYDEFPVPIGYYGKFTSGWNELGTMLTAFGVSTIDAMPHPIPPAAPNYPAKYWVGGTGTWDGTAGTKWATTPGGTGGAPIPAAGDNVVLSGAVTLAIDTPALRDVTVNGSLNIGARTIKGRMVNLQGTTFTMTSGRVEAAKQIVLSGTTFNLGSGTMEILDGSAQDFGGFYMPSAFDVWSSATINPGTSKIIINANNVGNEPFEVRPGNKSYGDVRINLGVGNALPATVSMYGAATCASFDVRSFNGAANVVNFKTDSSITTPKLIAMGTPGSANKLAINAVTPGTTNHIRVTSRGASYGSNVFMNTGILATSYATLRIGSNSTKLSSSAWIIGDNPKIDTVVQDFSTLSSINASIWDTATTTGGTVTKGASDDFVKLLANATAGSSATLSLKDTYDITDKPLLFKYSTVGASEGQVILSSGVSSFPVDLGAGHTPLSGYIKVEMGDSPSNDPGVWINTSQSTDGFNWTVIQSNRIDAEPAYDQEYWRASTISFKVTTGAAPGNELRIHTLNVAPDEPSGSNFLMFFGGA